MGRHSSKISRIEHGKILPSPADIHGWCDHCAANDQVADLVASLRAVESAYVEWRRLETSGLRPLQVSYLPLYEATRRFRVYQSHVVPGLIQTPDYATALLSSIAAFRRLPDDIEAAVTTRVERQRLLSHGDHRFAVVLEESVLRHQIGPADVMAAQLGHLIAVATLPSMSLGIIPFDTPDRPVWPVEGFGIFDDDRVNVELLSARVIVTQPREVAVYTQAFTGLAGLAVHGRTARSLITAAIDALGDDPGTRPA